MIITKSEKMKFFKISLIIISIILIIFIISLIILKYQVEGENKNQLPFNIDKITVVSSAKGAKKENAEYLWNGEIIQLNDIYIKIDKTNSKNISIKNIDIQNIKLETNIPELNKNITKIKTKETNENIDENLENINFKPGNNTNLEKLTVKNEGGTIGFRALLKNLGEYKSNEEEIKYDGTLLKYSNIDLSKFNLNIKFDLIIETSAEIKYKTAIDINLNLEELSSKGMLINELQNVEQLIFKRI